jgi:hypothetical protein
MKEKIRMRLNGALSVLVIRQPWAWLVVNGLKDTENRNWKCKHRGPLLIQSSQKRPSAADYDEAAEYARDRGVKKLPAREALECGGIVGIVNLIDCVGESDSVWYEDGCFAWVLEDATPLPFVPCKGKLLVYPAPREIVEAVRPHIPEGFIR